MQKFFFAFFLIALIYSKRNSIQFYSILFYSICHNLMRWHTFDALAYTSMQSCNLLVLLSLCVYGNSCLSGFA